MVENSKSSMIGEEDISNSDGKLTKQSQAESTMVRENTLPWYEPMDETDHERRCSARRVPHRVKIGLRNVVRMQRRKIRDGVGTQVIHATGTDN